VLDAAGLKAIDISQAAARRTASTRWSRPPDRWLRRGTSLTPPKTPGADCVYKSRSTRSARAGNVDRQGNVAGCQTGISPTGETACPRRARAAGEQPGVPCSSPPATARRRSIRSLDPRAHGARPRRVAAGAPFRR
jgi:hypothetical protein